MEASACPNQPYVITPVKTYDEYDDTEPLPPIWGEYHHGALCEYCGNTVTIRVSFRDVRDHTGRLIDVSVETDRAWPEHIARCKNIDGPP